MWGEGVWSVSVCGCVCEGVCGVRVSVECEGVYYYTEYIIICSECVCGDHILIPTPNPTHTHLHTHIHTHTHTHTHTHPRRCCPPSCIHSYTHHIPRAPLQSSSADKRYDTLCVCVYRDWKLKYPLNTIRVHVQPT